MQPRTIIAARHVVVAGTNLSWTGLRGWLGRVEEICTMIVASSAHYRRCHRLLESLTIDDITMSFDVGALQRAEQLFDLERHDASLLFYGPFRAWSRDQIAERLQATRARLTAVRNGRAVRPKAKGPSFSPAHLPDRRVEALIQSHPDMVIVDALRAERERRCRADRSMAPIAH